MIKLVKVNKYFNRRKRNQMHIINNTSLELGDNGLVAILGSSGSGKTTLLNAIGGLDKVNSGKIYINGKKITHKRAYTVDKIRNLNMGYIFQDYKLLENMSVYDNVALSLKMMGIKNKKEIQKRVNEELGFTVNIGLSNNKLLAKMASDFEKPNKIHTLYPKEIQNKMWPLPVGELFMLGRKSVPKLYNMHIKTIGDLAEANLKELTNKFGKHGKMMWEYANGIDESEVIYNYGPPKSIGNSTTLAKDVGNLETLNEILLTLAEHVAYRLRKYKMVANVVNVGLRTKDFKDFSHQKKLDFATANTKDIYLKAKELLKEMYNGEEIRLVALRVDKLTNKNEAQISLFETEKERKQEKLDEVLDNLKEKYGYEKITRAGKMGIEKNIKLK